jgi:geranylgeranyl pyrophosphate synthase
LDAVTRYAQNLGLLFQITDDLLDVTATEKELGKTPGKDARSAKATYPALYGLEEARSAAMKAHHDAVAALTTIDQPTETLRQIADFTLNRSR